MYTHTHTHKHTHTHTHTHAHTPQDGLKRIHFCFLQQRVELREERFVHHVQRGLACLAHLQHLVKKIKKLKEYIHKYVHHV